MLIRDVIQAYLASHVRGRGREDHRHAAWWCAQIGQEESPTLSTSLIVMKLDALAAYGRRPATVGFYLRFLRRVCAWGALMSYLPADPCAGMTLPKESPQPMRALTEDEERRLCGILGPPYSLWIKLAIETGLKQSEQFTLRWRDVDLKKATLFLPQSNGGAVTTLRVSPQAIAILEQLRQLHPPSLWVFPDLKNPFRAVNIHAFYVGRWVNAVHRANIPWCTWKDLRHTAGVRLAQQGLSATDITRALRHREARQAYHYRAWKPDAPAHHPRKRCPSPPVFDDSTTEELQQALLRDLSERPVTLGEVCRLYALHHLKRRPSRRQFDGIFRQFFVPWKERLLTSVSRKEVRAWYLGLSHIPSHANKALTFLRSVFNWALDLELIHCANPTLRIRRYPEPPRERYLKEEEAQRFLQGLSTLPPKQHAYLLLVLLTGARKSEARQMRWQDIDETARLWRKPRTKNGRPHLIPLPTQALETIQRLPRQGPWVFAGMTGGPWCAATVDKFWAVARRRWGLDDISIHDLRRSCGSFLASHGENLPTIQNVLGHNSLAPTSIYARLNTKAVDRALQAQADRLFSLGATEA